MTRENKAGLVIAGSFLVLAGVVLTLKLRERAASVEPDLAVEAAQPPGAAPRLNMPSAPGKSGPLGRSAGEGNPGAPPAKKARSASEGNPGTTPTAPPAKSQTEGNGPSRPQTLPPTAAASLPATPPSPTA